MLERLHTVLHTEITAAIGPISHLERTWSPSEMVRRLTRYLYRAACQDNLCTQQWEHCIKSFIAHAMQSYAASCQEKEWFYELDLAPVFQLAAWEILTAVPARQGAEYRVVEEFAESEYQSYLDETLNNKAMWIAVSTVIPDSKNQLKVFTALQKTYQAALDYVLADTRPLEDIRRLEMFIKKWMEDSLTRAWNSVAEPERNLTENISFKLFWKLMAPFGAHHGFSCVPQVLTERIGRPPDRWPFISQTVRGIYQSWSLCIGTKKKRRKTAGDDGEAVIQVADSVEEDDKQEIAEESNMFDAEAGPELDGGHPRCTSQEDCQGTEDDTLVRHLLNGKPGDIYCKTCWTSFLEQNPHLEGEDV